MSIFDFISDVARAAVDTVERAGKDMANNAKKVGDAVKDAATKAVDIVTDKREEKK